MKHKAKFNTVWELQGELNKDAWNSKAQTKFLRGKHKWTCGFPRAYRSDNVRSFHIGFSKSSSISSLVTFNKWWCFAYAPASEIVHHWRAPHFGHLPSVLVDGSSITSYASSTSQYFYVLKVCKSMSPWSSSFQNRHVSPSDWRNIIRYRRTRVVT